MKPLLVLLAMALALGTSPARAAESSAQAITVSQGPITIPTYESVGRYMQPPLFSDSTLSGLYPFTTYKRTFKKGSPLPVIYPAVFVESKYFKLTYIPQLGGRFFSLYDKVHHRQMFYRNDVIKPTQFGPRFTWPQSGIELTGPYDVHMLTLHGEPYWSHTILRHKDGSVSVMLGEIDPIYHMNVTFTATLYPNIDALKISTFCYNGNDGQKPQMFWSNAAFPVTKKLRFLYPMTQTVGHTTGVVSPWPIYKGVDLSWAHNNMNMLGVFGIDSYGDYGGAYEVAKNYGVFRYADRRVVQGMKMWTFGFGPGWWDTEQSYTDKAGPYFEAQSGRMVWDGHYEWVYPHKEERWHEWWIPVAGINGVTAMTNKVALHLTVTPGTGGQASSIQVALSPVRPIQNAKLMVKADSGVLLNTTVDLVPGAPVLKAIHSLGEKGSKGLQVTITAADGKVLLDYRRPDTNPGGHVTPFAKGLLTPPIPPSKMTAEQLVLAARFKQKDLNAADAAKLAKLALKIDPGYSSAQQLLGMLDYNQGHLRQAASEFQQAVNRNPYASQSWYYLSVCEIRLGDTKDAERNLYYVWPDSTFYGAREYQLGRLAFLRHDNDAAVKHLLGSINYNGDDIDARLLLAMTYRTEKKNDAAMAQLAKVSAVEPVDRLADAERYFLTGDKNAESLLRSRMGEQSEDAIQASIWYSSLSRWREALAVLKMVEPPHNKDPWGTPPVYYYTLAYAEHQSGDTQAAAQDLKKAQAAAGKVERFPYRRQTVAPLQYAVKTNPNDTVARYDLGLLLFSLGHQTQAVQQWQAVNRINPSDFNSRRALGLAYEELGHLQQAVPQLEKAHQLKPGSMITLDDLADVYARTGKFDKQLALLQKAVAQNPNDDHLVESELDADLIQGKFQAAQQIVDHHTFLPVHRTYSLRTEYRELKYGMGAQAFHQGNYQKALQYFQDALKPPASLGMDNFEMQSTPQIHYYIGRTLDAMGRKQEAKQAYEKSVQQVDQLTGGGSSSWSPENFYMVFSLDRLGREQEAAALVKQFQTVADARMESSDPSYSARAHYLTGMLDLYRGHPEMAKQQMQKAVQIEPDDIGPRYELRGDSIDPATGQNGK